MAQTWKINGQVFTHGQLMEMKRQGLNPHKDVIVMKFISGGKRELPGKPVELEKVELPEEIAQQPEEAIQDMKAEVPGVEAMQGEVQVPEAVEPELPTNFMQLKKLAADQGMAVTKETKKADIIAFLSRE